MIAVRLRTRKEMQEIVRPEVLDVIEQLGRISVQANGGIEQRLLQEGVQGDEIDVRAAIRKLHFIGYVKLSHPILLVPGEDGQLYDKRHHVLTFIYRPTSS